MGGGVRFCSPSPHRSASCRSRLTAAERTTALSQHRAPIFARWTLPFDVDDVALASDVRGRVWVAVGGAPQIALLDPATGRVQTYQYAAPSVAGHPLPFNPGGAPRDTPPAGAVTTDSQGRLTTHNRCAAGARSGPSRITACYGNSARNGRRSEECRNSSGFCICTRTTPPASLSRRGM